jgi:hypothetical protein
LFYFCRSVTQAVPGEDKKRVKSEIAYVTFAASVILRKNVRLMNGSLKIREIFKTGIW